MNGIPILIPDETIRAFGVPRSSKWNAVRRAHLDRYPSCAACGRDLYPEVHHIEPFHVRPDLELNPDNLLTLCDAPGASCHLLLGHLGNWSFWNPEIREVAKAFASAREEARKRVHTDAENRTHQSYSFAAIISPPTRAPLPDVSVWFYGSWREARRVWLGAFVAVVLVLFFALLSR